MTIWHRIVVPIMKHFRTGRVAILRDLCPELFDSETRKVVDVGGSQHFWATMPIDFGVKNIEIFNIDRSETGLTAGAASRIPVRLYDGRRLPLLDQSVDLIVCNSVIEHVPMQNRASLVAEMRRVARKVILQTPAAEFPIEPHFVFPLLHWFPRPIGRWLVFLSPWFWMSGRNVARARSYFDEVQLLSRPSLEKLIPDARIQVERIGPLAKSYVACVS